jgi:hypothetical protein
MIILTNMPRREQNKTFSARSSFLLSHNMQAIIKPTTGNKMQRIRRGHFIVVI